MAKILTLLALLMTATGAWATITVTWNNDDITGGGNSFTKDGVTITAGSIDFNQKNFMAGGTFTTTLGNFTKIVVTTGDCGATGTGWSGSTWTGNASSVSFEGHINGDGQGNTKFVFTIEPPTVAVTGITLDKTEASMIVGGETLTLTATVAPDDATDKTVTWTTSDAAVATVANGVVTAVAAGTATITATATNGTAATSDDKTATCTVTVATPAGTAVLNTDGTEAVMEMPAYDLTVNYTLVRDLEDQTNPVTFSGLPTTGNIAVKKGSDSKYQPAAALTIQLNDALISGDDKNIIAATDLTVTVEKKGEGDTWTSGTLADFLADMQPGTYKLKATPKDETSSYDGTVTSSEFTVVEQYDLTVKPADDYSKGKVESVTVGTEQPITPDANGEATKTGIAPNTEVKIKAKRGYIIEKVEMETKKTGGLK